MELLKKYFPYSFKGTDTLVGLIIRCIILLVVGAVLTFLIGILRAVPVVGLLVGLVCGLIDLYILISIILAILNFLKVLK